MAAFSSLAQVLFFILLSQTNVILSQTQCIEHEKDLLLALKDQLVFDSSRSIRLARWNQTKDCCTWHGVGCDHQGHVISLGLGEESISGGLDESSILFSLNYLEQLHLAGNLLSGSLPYSFGKLNRLTHLDLSNCSFSGPIPFTLSNLTQLVELDLSNNFFSGSILSTLSNLTLLVLMDLSCNSFTGSISSHHLQGLSDVASIDLSSNSLSGTIPLPIFTLPSLQQLRLDHNQFSGQISEFPIVNMSTQLFDLDLSSNRLESPIPNSFFNLRGLEYLYLSDNMFDHTFQLEKILSFPILYYLNLSSNNLQSLDEASSFLSSSSLDTLDLSDNRIAGEVPSWIWEIGGGTLFYLNLSCNMLVDLQKPNNLSASLSLQVLDLHSNQLRGELPPPPQQASYVDYSNNYFDSSIPNIGSFSGDNLQFLSLANNRLSGPIPTFGCNSTHLEVLDLSDNNLSGRIPPCLFQNFDNLILLNIRGNNITGRIPPNISPHCSLRSLDLSHNNLVGEVPLSLGNCNSLTVMNVGNNHIHGTFPCMLPSSLQVLVLRSNRFRGDVTCRKNESWPNLQIIDIASNHFSGNLNALNFSSWRGMTRSTVTQLSYKTLGFSAFDSWEYYQTAYRSWGYYRDEVNLTIKGEERRLVKIWPDFTCIDFSCNDFHGGIPDSIGVLDGLYLLNLSHNSLAGTIPTSFSKLTFLGALDLSVNRLTGKIPREIAGLTFLEAMNVSHNKLVGEIPSSTQIDSFSADCFEGNLGLCGLPLNIACSNINLVPPPPGNDGSEREIEWGYVFAATGYAVGLGSFSWLLLFCRGFRYKYFEKIEDVFENIFGCCQRKKKRRAKATRAARVQLTRRR